MQLQSKIVYNLYSPDDTVTDWSDKINAGDEQKMSRCGMTRTVLATQLSEAQEKGWQFVAAWISMVAQDMVNKDAEIETINRDGVCKNAIIQKLESAAKHAENTLQRLANHDPECVWYFENRHTDCDCGLEDTLSALSDTKFI